MKVPLIRLMRGEILLLLAVVLGTFLRLYTISEQIIADDEWHALAAALKMGYGELATHFGIADYCIPLALLYRVFLDTVGLSEMFMRAPMLLCGITSLVLLPLMVRLWLGKGESIIFAWLLAVSPFHVYFSRYARPYNIALFFAFVGMLSAFKWRTDGSRRWALLFAVCAVLGPYFHLTTLPFSVAPLLFFGIENLLYGRKSPPPRWKELVLLGCAVVSGLALLLGPPLAVDFRNLSDKAAATDPVVWNTLVQAFQFLGGTGNKWLLLVSAVFCFAGAVLLSGRNRRLLLYLLFLAGIQGAALFIARPRFMHHPYILARYGIVLLPIFLLLVSAGINALEGLFQRRLPKLPSGILAPLAAAVLLFYSPLIIPYTGPNNWTNHSHFQYQYQRHRIPSPFLARKFGSPGNIPLFYTRLGERADSARLLEVPWYYEWSNIPFVFYQLLHRQWMDIGFLSTGYERQRFEELPLSDPRYRFRHFVHVGDFEGIGRRGIRFVVFHIDLKSELALTSDKPHVDVQAWIDRYRSLVGEPVFEDQGIVVFDVSRREKESPQHE